MKVTIRRMRNKDIEGTIKAMRVAWDYSYETWEKDYYPREAHEFDLSQNTPENWDKSLADPCYFAFIALADGKIAGKVSGQVIGNSGFGMIRNIAVHPKYHRKGIGRMLVDAAINHLEKKGCHKVSLNTLPVLIPAINLYLKSGFVPEAYLAKQWWGVDFIYMSRWLPRKI